MNKTPECLPIHMVLALANAAAEKYGFRKLSGVELKRMYTTNSILPAIIRTSGDNMLWVDKWYVAVQLNRGVVRYLYITNHHINEEIASYGFLKKYRDDPAELPEDIRKQFKAARRWMLPTQQKLYFTKTAEDLGLAWVNTWRQQTKKELQRLMVEERSA